MLLLGDVGRRQTDIRSCAESSVVAWWKEAIGLLLTALVAEIP